jgi:very-short-patch-repair endonuclease
MQRKVVDPDAATARIAARQHGIVTLAQLYWAGLSPEAVRHRVRSRRLFRIHRGVYALGRRDLTQKGRWMAAVKACGEGAALSQRSAGELWGMLILQGGVSHVAVPVPGGRARREGICIHRIPSLAPSMKTLRDGLPVTKPGRTLADLRLTLEPAEFRDAIRTAERANLPIGNYSHLVHRTRSELEWMLLELIRRHGLPEPEVNVRVGRFLVDFLWRERKLIVETDGERFHRGEVATAQDLVRDHRLRILGFAVLRFGYWQVVNEPLKVVAIVRSCL